MSSARLEVINDDPAVAPRMSRAIPAALYGIVTSNAYEEFCNKMDELFDSLDAEYRRRKKRFWWMYGAIFSWYMFSLIFGISLVMESDYAALFALIILCATHIGTVWYCTARPAGVKSDAESMRDIRLACDEMTNRTPFVSFHVVLMPTPAAARGAWLQMNTIDHIAVSISASASASATGTAAAAAVSTIMNDTNNEKMNEATDNHQPVVYAQAVVNGNYQPVPHGDGVELV
jgi:hypothetical protein